MQKGSKAGSQAEKQQQVTQENAKRKRADLPFRQQRPAGFRTRGAADRVGQRQIRGYCTAVDYEMGRMASCRVTHSKTIRFCATRR